MRAKDRVQCSRYHLTLTASACVTRHLARRDGRASHLPAYEACAKCPIGRDRAKRLEEAGEPQRRRLLRFTELLAVGAA